VQKIVSIVGLTASGKSGLGIKLAQMFNGEIISADSRQVYRGLDIGSAKVTREEQATVRHHLLDVKDPGEHFDVYEFQRQAYDAIDDILKRGKLPILVGGTGLYSRSVVEGYAFNSHFKTSPAATAAPPYIKGELSNLPRYDVLQICLMPSKEWIRPLVEKRIDERLANGMLEETRELLSQGVPREWLKSLGLEYYWNVELLDGNVTLNEYKTQLATKTMQFAKRQRTWFKREKSTHFLTDPSTFHDESINLVKNFYAQNCQ
jgi:tRNA dimethylallyltransferase